VTELVSADRVKPGTQVGVTNERPDAGRLKRTARRLLGWLRYRSDSIGPPWLLHATTNLAAAILLAT
jgi:hypothetical protein